MALYETTTSNNISSVETKDGINKIVAKISDEYQLICSKTITADDGYYYEVTPSIKIITQHPDKYRTKKINQVYDSLNRLTSITIEVYFLFTGEDIKASDGDEFIVRSTPVEIPATTKQFINKASIHGEPIGVRGGTRVVKIFGDPGAIIRATLKSNTGLYYNWDSRNFSTTATSKNIKIPTVEDFEGSLATDYKLGTFVREVRFPRQRDDTASYSIEIGEIQGGESIKQIAESGSFESGQEVLEEVQNDVILTMSVKAFDGLTFGYSGLSELNLGPYTSGSLVNESIIPDSILDTGFVITATRTSGGGSFTNFTVPSINNFTNIADEATAKGWEVTISVDILERTSTQIKVAIEGTIIKAGTNSLVTEFDFDSWMDYEP